MAVNSHYFPHLEMHIATGTITNEPRILMYITNRIELSTKKLILDKINETKYTHWGLCQVDLKKKKPPFVSSSIRLVAATEDDRTEKWHRRLSY